MRFTWIMAILIVAAGCWLYAEQDHSPSDAAPATMPADAANPAFRQATFAAGCFWGVQATFDKVPGVVSTTAGYTGGTVKNPTYEQVCTHATGHAESVLVVYDPRKVSYARLLDIFWSCHDPTTVNRQGPDIGSNYRSAIFYHDADEERIAKASLKEVADSGVFKAPIATQIVAAGEFYPAEVYYQHFFAKQGTTEMCHVGPVKVHTKLATAAQPDLAIPPATQPQ